MIEVRKAIQTHLKSIHPQVFFLKAPETAQFPHIVYEVEIINQDDSLQLVTLDVDGWDNTKNTTSLENLMSKIDKSLNRKITINENLSIIFYLDRKLPLLDDDPQLNRSKYIYQARLYERL